MSHRKIVEAIDALIALTVAGQAAEATQFGSEAQAQTPDGRTLVGAEGSQQIIPATPNSLGLIISVPSSNDKIVFLAFGEAAQLNKGISLIPGAPPLALLTQLSALALFAITESAGATIAWQQFTMAP